MDRFFKLILNIIPRPWLIKISVWLRPLVSWWFRGKGLMDPIDGKSYRKFLPYGYQNIRKNALSPGTLSLERHRALWLFLKRKTGFFQEKAKVLHLAPEQAFYKRFKKMSNLEYVTADLDSPLADVKADITSLPFEDNTFDVVFCNHVLEHIPDDRKAMKELFRVMKPGGYGVFQVPLDRNRDKTFEDPSVTDPQKRAKLFGQYDHVRVYGMDFFKRLEEAGFEVNAVEVKSFCSEDEIKKYALDEHEIIPFIKKPHS